jgi:ribosomal protein S27AE
MIKHKIVEENEEVRTILSLKLKVLFRLEVSEVVCILARNGVIKNQQWCPKCGPKKAQAINKRADISDGIQWQCGTCRSKRTIRDGSIFEGRLYNVHIPCFLIDFANRFKAFAG